MQPLVDEGSSFYEFEKHVLVHGIVSLLLQMGIGKSGISAFNLKVKHLISSYLSKRSQNKGN